MEQDINALKERFLDIYRTNIKRDGGDKLLDYLTSKQCDFFTAIFDKSKFSYIMLVDYIISKTV